MIKNSLKQKGSAHVIIIVILVIALIGTLGFVFWQNFIKKDSPGAEKKETLSDSNNSENTPSKNTKQYETETYSFEYPSAGWVLHEESYDINKPNEITPVVKTIDWKQNGMGLDAGAEVTVYVATSNRTLAQMKEDTSTFPGGVEDLKDIKIDGVEAFSYNSSYEGVRYHTVFIKNGFEYDLIYRFETNGNAKTYMPGYNTVTSSFKFK